jgi:hypothetical protein
MYESLADFPFETLTTPRNRKVVKDLLEKAAGGNDQYVFETGLQIYAENYHKAITGVMDKAKPGSDVYGYRAQFIHNASNVAAYKSHRMMEELSAATDDKEREKIVKKHNAWQAVEHNAMVSRTRTARQFMDFETRKDIYPNLEWIQSRSANPREAHLALVGLVLPMNHTFWQSNQPGNLYGCKCDWKQTDAKPAAKSPANVTPSPGLDGNPLNTGQLITNKHPYIAKADKKVVPKRILELPDKFGYVEFKTESGQKVDVHIMHGTDELKKNLTVANGYLKSEKVKECKLLPKIHQLDDAQRKHYYPKSFKQKEGNEFKDADAVISLLNGKKLVADFKLMEGKGRNLLVRIQEAAEKADYAIIMLDKKTILDEYKVRRTASGPIKDKIIKGVIVLDHNSNIIYKSY